MDRRSFLLRSAFILAGTFFGGPIFSRAFCCEVHEEATLFQPRIALIIDDIGHSLSRAEQFLNLDIPLTFSILPLLPHSLELAKEIHAEGRQIMLHQPMEPYNIALDPGPGAIYVGDSTEKIARITNENVESIPFAIGVNNHMGSRFTEHQKGIRDVLGVIKSRALFFVDSLTSHRSKAYGTARRLRIATACRNIFLDNLVEESAILSQLSRLKKQALILGHGIGIGHPFPETARAIKRFYGDLEACGVSLVSVSHLLYPGQGNEK
jgi:polysaccharide deacetylase 2 family uncharacterized protein YibQ